MKIIILLSLLASSYAHTISSSPLEEHWHVHTASLPSPVSDHSATLNPDTGKVYLVGGCNNTDGNVRVPPDDFFICPDVTSYANVFDATTGSIEAMPEAPRKRYRHAAVYHDGLVWLLGGRDDTVDPTSFLDNVVADVDVFDVATNKWRTDLSFKLPDDLVKSDHAAFVIGDTIYMVGGFEFGYNATATTIAIDIPKSLTSKTELKITTKKDMNVARGDCFATVADGVAFVVGGFTHLDEWSNALATVESYDPFNDLWTVENDLVQGRGDKAVVTVGSKIYVVGGESKTDGQQDPGQRTNPTAEVEVLDTSDPNAFWTEEIADIPADHFRFPAVSYDGVIYTFGGQGYYDASCFCFATKSNILTFDTKTDYKQPESGSTKAKVIGVVAAVATLLML